MPEFNCKTLTPQGQIVRSVVEESSRLACIRKLRKNGLTPISVTPRLAVKIKITTSQKAKNLKPEANFEFKRKNDKTKGKNQKTQSGGIWAVLTSDVGGGGRKITSRDIRVFTQNFYLLKKANFNNIHALSTVIATTENPRLKTILEDILAGVEAGEYMYTTMEYYSSVFPYIYINMIKVGELSGSLDLSLEQAITYLENSDTLSKRIKKILVPNLLMFFGLIIGTIVAVIVGVPMLKNIFDSVGSQEELPAITMWLYNTTLAIKQVWYVPVGLILAGAGLFYVWLSTPKGRYNFDYFKYTMPIFGKLIYLLDFSRLMQCVLLNIQNGMRIQDALEVSKSVVKNTVMMSMVETAINNIFIGQSWIDPFEEAALGDTMCIEMLRIGMQTDLPEMISKMLDYVESDINNTLEKIVKVLPEISYLFVGVVLIFFVCAVLVPCISLYMGGWMFSAYDV
jgi:type II secretory pathway component PulF